MSYSPPKSWWYLKRQKARRSDVIASIFADGTDGFYFDFSDVSKLWQDTAGSTPVAAPGDSIGRVGDRSPRGNNGTQATGLSQPTYQAGGLARCDGLNDSIGSAVVPGTAMTYMVKAKLVSTNKALMGSSNGTNRSFLSFVTGGLIAAGVGSQSTGTIKGNVSHTGQTGVIALVYDGETVELYWNAAQEYSAAQVGSGANAVAIPLGAISSSGVLGSYADHDFYHALAVKKALSPSWIEAVTRLWS